MSAGQVYLVLFLMVLTGAVTWHVKGKCDEADLLAAQRQADQKTQAAMKVSSAIDTSFAASEAHLRQLEASATQKIEALHANPAPAHCRPSAARLSILDAAIAAGHPAR